MTQNVERLFIVNRARGGKVMENDFAEIHIFDVGFGESIYVKVTRSDTSKTSYLIDTGYAKK